MDDQPTCGKGLAANAELPNQLSVLTAALAGVLEQHMPALDLTDQRSAHEHEEYRQLSEQFRTIAAQLHKAAAHMMSLRDLPMGKHDFRVMAAAGPRDAFRDFVAVEQEVANLLEQRLKQDRVMLVQMGGGDSP